MSRFERNGGPEEMASREKKSEGRETAPQGDAENFAAEASREKLTQAEVGAEVRAAKENIAGHLYKDAQKFVESSVSAGQTRELSRFLERFAEMGDDALATESLRRTRRGALNALESNI